MAEEISTNTNIVIVQFYVWRKSYRKVVCNRAFAWRGRRAHLSQLFIKNARLHRHLVYVSWRWYVLTYKVNLISLGLKIMWPCLIFAGKSYVKCRLYWQYIWSLSVCGQLLSKDMIGLANGKLNERKKIDGDIGVRYQSFIGYTNSWSHKRW